MNTSTPDRVDAADVTPEPICNSHTVELGQRVEVIDKGADYMTGYDAVVIATYPDRDCYAVVIAQRGRRRRLTISDWAWEDGYLWATPPEPRWAYLFNSPLRVPCEYCGAAIESMCLPACPLVTGRD